jgi:hypothetical protein
VGANTYEAVAIALRSGAQKPLEEVPAFRKEPVFTPKPKFEGPEEKKAAPAFVKPQPQEEKKVTEEKPQPSSKPPADWFEPKIFKGTNFTS